MDFAAGGRSADPRIYADLARMQGSDRTFYVGGATDFELVEPIVVHSKSIVETHFAGVVQRAN